MEARIDPAKDEIIWNDLVDNRDFKAMQSWDPRGRFLIYFVDFDYIVAKQVGAAFFLLTH